MITINSYIIEPTIFPDKTSQIWKLPEEILNMKEVNIVWRFEDESELFQLLQLKTLIDKEMNVRGFCCLHIPFLPYGRQDKEISNESTFALESFSKIINIMNFDYVSTYDVHSKKSVELINNLDDIFPKSAIRNVLTNTDKPLIAYPDKGAEERYSSRYTDFDNIIGDKVRNQLTGYIESYKITGDDYQDRNIVIIDDICDGGMTFRLLTKELLKNGAKSVTLYITHGIFSQGLEVLKEDGITRIFTLEGEIK